MEIINYEINEKHNIRPNVRASLTWRQVVSYNDYATRLTRAFYF